MKRFRKDIPVRNEKVMKGKCSAALPLALVGAFVLTEGIAKAGKEEPLKAPGSIVRVCTSMHGSAVEVANKLHDLLKVKGEMGITEEKGFYKMPRTAAKVGKDKKGDCSELTYYFVSCALGALASNEKVVIGAIEANVKGYPSNIRHILPFLLVKGDVPEKYVFRDFETNKKFRESVFENLNLEGNGWKMIVIDLQSSEFGKIKDQMSDLTPVNLDGIKGAYYREAGMHYLKKKKVDKALNAFETAVKYNSKDGLSHTNLSILLMRKGDLEKAFEHAEAAYESLPGNEGIKGNYIVALVNMGIKSLNDGIGEFNGGNPEEGIEKLKDAKAYFEEALKLNPKDKNAKKGLKEANRLLNQIGAQ